MSVDQLSSWEKISPSSQPKGGGLVIDKVSMFDSGVYECEAHNSVGRHSAIVQLEVHCKLQR